MVYTIRIQLLASVSIDSILYLFLLYISLYSHHLNIEVIILTKTKTFE